MNRILLILLALFAVLIIFYFVLISFAPHQTKKEQLPPIQVAPSYSPTVNSNSTANPFAKMPMATPADLKPLQVISVEPKENLALEYNPVTEIKISFSDDIDLNNFLLNISPDTQITIIPDTTTNTYTISPNKFWPNGVATITIKQGTKSMKGATLENTFIYKINFQDPKNPPDDAAL